MCWHSALPKKIWRLCAFNLFFLAWSPGCRTESPAKQQFSSFMVVLCSAFLLWWCTKVFLGHYLTIPLITQLPNNLILSNLTYFLLQSIVSLVSSFQFPSKPNLFKDFVHFHWAQNWTLLRSSAAPLSWACFSSPHFIQLPHLQSEISRCNQQGISHRIYFILLCTLHYTLCSHEQTELCGHAVLFSCLTAEVW